MGTLEELYDKHHILTDGLKRIYVVSLEDRRLDMDSSTPVELHFLAKKSENDDLKLINFNPEEVVIKSGAWNRMIEKLCLELQNRSPKPLEQLYNFRVDWSNAEIFSKTKVVKNMIQLSGDLYVNIGHTANHLLWLIQDIIHFYDTEDHHAIGCLLVHRPPFSEPSEVVNEVEKVTKAGYQELVSRDDRYSELVIKKIFNAMDALNYLLKKTGTAYNNFFQMDSYQTFQNYKSKLLNDLPLYVNWNKKQMTTANLCLVLLGLYFSERDKEAKKQPIHFFIPVL